MQHNTFKRRRPHQRIGNCRHRRAGTLYIVAMGTSLIVVCLALASLQAVRVQRRINEESLQLKNACILAQAGIEFAQQRVVTDPGWRTFFTHGVAVSRTSGDGAFSVVLSDPDDGIIANDSTDPVIITSTGTCGQAIQKWTAYLEPQSQLFAACRSSLFASTRLSFVNCNVTANQWAYSEDQIQSNANAAINLNCQAKNSISSNGMNQRALQGGTWPMDKLDLATASNSYVGKYYIDNSVIISATDLPTGGTELAKNGGFESDTSHWTTMNCTLTRDTSQKRFGVASCLVSGQGFISTPVQDITEQMIKGRQYNISFWIRTTEDQKISSILSLTGSGSVIPVVKISSSVNVQSGVWTQISTTTDATWSGTLTKAEFQIGSEKNSNYHFDGVSIVDAERQTGTRYIENEVLGSGINPYGTKTVSPNGVYSINAPGEKILIRNCRINGTLVVQAASKVELAGALSWVPAGRNFPALIADAPIDDLTSNTALSESTIGINTNPAASPIQGVSDTDTSDSSPSFVTGAVVSTSDILLDGVSTYSGPIYSGDKIDIRSANLTINFLSDMILNPPPGFFADPPKMRLIPSSVQSLP